MSDPVTNVEIEDVLSSIRRLVSNEERDPKAGGDSEAPAGDRLVLSPAQRVDGQADAPEDMAPENMAPEDESGFEEPPGEVLEDDAGAGMPTDAHALSDAADGAPAGEEMDHEAAGFGDADAWREVLDAETAAAMPAPAPEEPPAAEAPDDPDAPGVDIGTLEARVAEFEAAVAERDDDWEPDGAPEDAFDNGNGTAMPWHDHEPAEPEAAPGAEEAAAGPDRTADAAPLSAGLSDGDAPGAPEEEEEEDSAAADLFSGADELLDEEALRDMVTEIVRQELQGALGERITRNVRKLVRREIHRALTNQELS